MKELRLAVNLRRLAALAHGLGLALVCACGDDLPAASDAGPASLRTDAGGTPAAADGGRGGALGSPVDSVAGHGGSSGKSGSGGLGAAGQRPVDQSPAQDAGDDSDSGTAPMEPPLRSTPLRALECPKNASYGDPLPAQRGATLVQGGFGFIEGPVWVPTLGVLLFSDLNFDTSDDPNGPDAKIRRFTPPHAFDVLVQHSGSNGLALANDGTIVAATHDVQSLSRFDPQSGARQMLELRYQGKHFNSPNDLALRSDGNIYFSDPDWQLGPRTSETGMRGLYRVAPSGEVSLVDDSLTNVNGVALSPDEQVLYAGSQGDDLMRYPLDALGKPGSGEKLATPGSSDGMTVDCAGNVYISAGKVQVYSSTGTKLGEIDVPEEPSNAAFGGAARKTLYITAQSGLYSIELNIPGRAY
jgi:gluconolactonase